jgi:peptide/nickel transport system permease protein
MAAYLIRRTFSMAVTLFLLSVVCFILVQLPPGDYISTLQAQAAEAGVGLSDATVETLRQRYGLGEPIWVQYLAWARGIVQGDFGFSFTYNQPVTSLILDRVGATLVLTVAAMLFAWVVALPIGIYSATRQYSIGDYLGSAIGLIGIAIPNFLLALVLIWIGFKYFGVSVGGLLSAQYENTPWTAAKFADFLSHLWLPVIIIGTDTCATLIRTTRANLLDELKKPYVEAARAKGLSEIGLVLKYPVRIALIPFVSTVGLQLPHLVSGAAITSIVMNLPTVGPILLTSLLSQDMYLAGGIVLILCVMTVVGTFISDLMLAWLDPRVRLY